MSENPDRVLSDRVWIDIGGNEFDGWTEVRVSRRLNALTAGFDISLRDSLPGTDRRTIQTGAAVKLWIGKTLLLTGFIVDTDKATDSSGRDVRVAGQDRTVDLLDCSAVHKPGSWKGQKLERIARDLLSAFGLELDVRDDTGAPFALFALEQSETVFDALTRLARLRGLLITTDTKAQVVFYKPAPPRAGYTLEMGRNIYRIGVRNSWSGRFSEYHLKGQHGATGRVTAKDATAPKAVAYDKGVDRYRPLVIISDEQSTLAGLKARAQFEATAHMAAGLAVNITMAGWRDDSKERKLFEPYVLVYVYAPDDDIDGDLMVEGVDLILTPTEQYAQLTLVLPQAYTTEAIPEPKKKKAKKGKAVDLLPFLHD